jgi:hypothetical protein
VFPGGLRSASVCVVATSSSREPVEGAIWAGVDRLVDRAPRLSDLRTHRLQLLAARRWRELGRPVPPDLLHEERMAGIATLSVEPVLKQVRAAYGGRIMLLKGPEVAAHYPNPSLRPLRDLDLLVADADDAQSALIAAGFEEYGDPELYEDIHHLRPLLWRRLPLLVEIHSRPKWIDGLEPPTNEELFSLGERSSLGIDGVLSLPPAYHALMLAAHSWAHFPLGRVSDLVDVAAMSEGLDREELRALARGWGIGRVWGATIGSVDALLFGARSPFPLRLWGRHLSRVRDRTVLENHLERWLSSLWALPLPDALSATASTVLDELTPAEGETWGNKLSRTRAAARNAFTRRSEHDQRLGEEAFRRRRRRR